MIYKGLIRSSVKEKYLWEGRGKKQKREGLKTNPSSPTLGQLNGKRMVYEKDTAMILEKCLQGKRTTRLAGSALAGGGNECGLSGYLGVLSQSRSQLSSMNVSLGANLLVVWECVVRASLMTFQHRAFPSPTWNHMCEQAVNVTSHCSCASHAEEVFSLTPQRFTVSTCRAGHPEGHIPSGLIQ